MVPAYLGIRPLYPFNPILVLFSLPLYEAYKEGGMVMDSLNLYKAKEIYITNDLYKYIREVM